MSDFSRAEIKQITYASYIKGVYLSFIMFTTRVTVYVTVVAYVLLGNEISAEKVKFNSLNHSCYLIRTFSIRCL